VQDINEREAYIESNQERWHQFRPYLVLTLPGLVHQTAGDIVQFSSYMRVVSLGSRHLRKGRSVAKRSPNARRPYRIASSFDDPKYFDPNDPETGRTVAVASYLWYARRYGPKEYHRWLKEEGFSRKMPREGEWDRTPRAAWPNNMEGRFRAICCDEAADGLRNPSTFWFSVLYTQCSRKWLFTGSPAPRGLVDYASYLALLQTPEFNASAKKSHKDIGYIVGQTDPYELADDHPAAKFRAAEYCYRKFIVDNENLKGYQKGLKAQKCLSLFVIRRDVQSDCPFGSGNTIARSLPPKHHYYVEKILSPTGARYYEKFSAAFLDRLMLLRADPDRPDEKGTPTPNGRSARALEWLSFFWPLGHLHVDNPVDRNVRARAREGIFPTDRLLLNRDRESFFWEDSPIHQEMPKLSKKNPGVRLRWLFSQIQRAEREKRGSKSKVFDDYNFEDMTPKELAQTFLNYSPKMQAIVALLQYHAILRGEKVLVWFQYPFNQQLAQEVLVCLGISPISMYKESSSYSRARIQERINDPSDPIRVLLLGVRVGGTGLNLQKDSHVSISVDAFTSLDQQIQTEGRQYRTGQVVECCFYQLAVVLTHDIKVLW